MDGDTLIAAMTAALPYAALDTTRPVLSGITLVLGTPIEIAAGDGFRMSHQVLGLSFPLEEKIIIPAHAVAILSHVFKKTPRTPPSTAGSLVQVVTSKRQLRMSAIGDNKLRLDFGTSASVVINLIMGKPPEWLALIPKGEPILQSQIFAPTVGSSGQTCPRYCQRRQRHRPSGVCRWQAESIRQGRRPGNKFDHRHDPHPWGTGQNHNQPELPAGLPLWEAGHR